MTLPSNVRSLFAFGAFCVMGGAWLALVTGIRTSPLRLDTDAAFAAQERESEPPPARSMPIENTRMGDAIDLPTHVAQSMAKGGILER
jgi:hypothetical protein